MNSKNFKFWTSAVVSVFFLLSAVACTKEKKETDIEALIKKPSLTQKEQQTLATALFEKMIKADEDELDVFEANYKIVIEKCPDTEQAHTAVHRLTNLYTRAYYEPKHEDIIAILEPFLERTKESTVLSMVKYPEERLVFSPLGALHLSYQQLGQYDKIASYYDDLILQNPDLGTYDCFDYADALDNCDRLKDAIHWYEEFLKKSEGSDMDFMRQIAQDRLEEIRNGENHLPKG